MTNHAILLLDDGHDTGSSFQDILQQRGYLVLTSRVPEEAAACLRENRVDAMLVHLAAAADCAPLLDRADGAQSVPTIVLASRPSAAEALALGRLGLADYLEPPFGEEQLLAALDRVVAGAPPAERPGRGFAKIIGESPQMQQVFSLISKVCDTDTTVLVRGESGTGKELIAQALHYEGTRCRGPFVPVNCGAIPTELLESELFGHEKGAFTHAIRTRVGRFELADGGTIFLDEISEMSPMLQVKILRVLQERQFERIGGTKTIRSDFRVVAATNRDLEEEVARGSFREDLYYRLNVIPIEAPPLRERGGDLDLLVTSFIDKFNGSKRKTITGIDDEALAVMKRYHWPGNVRELENVVERMVILAPGNRLTVDDLPERVRQGAAEAPSHAAEAPVAVGEQPLSEVVANFEKRLIVQALEQTDWVKNRAAKLLQVNRTTLIEKMKRYNLVRPE